MVDEHFPEEDQVYADGDSPGEDEYCADDGMSPEDGDNSFRISDLDFSDLYVSERGASFKQGGNPEPQDIDGALLDEARSIYWICKEHEGSKGTDFTLEYGSTRYRVSKMPTISGVFYVLRRLPSSVPDLNSLGLHPGIVKRLMLPKLKGLVLIAGATGSGKSTTAGALVKHRMHTLGGVCVTVEDPPEMPLAGRNGKGLCYQVEAERGDFATPCRSILRWAPDIIFLGEIRDAASAVEAVRASINGHLVIGTIHADNVISTVERIYGMISGVSPNDAGSMLANGLMAVLHQSLSRQKGVARAFLKTEWLFFAGREGEAPRTNVRERNFKMLVSHIEAQERRLVRNIETDLNQF